MGGGAFELKGQNWNGTVNVSPFPEYLKELVRLGEGETLHSTESFHLNFLGPEWRILIYDWPTSEKPAVKDMLSVFFPLQLNMFYEKGYKDLETVWSLQSILLFLFLSLLSRYNQHQ